MTVTVTSQYIEFDAGNGLYRTLATGPVSASVTVQGTPNIGQDYAGFETRANTALAGDFSTYAVVESLRANWDVNSDETPGWVNNGGLRFGSDFGRDFSVSVMNLVSDLQARQLGAPELSVNGTTFANGSGAVTSITIIGDKTGYAANQTNIDVIVITTTSGAAQNKRISANTNSSGVLTTFNGLPLTGFNANERLYAFVERPPITTPAGIVLDIAPLLNLSRQTTDVWPAAGSILGGISFQGGTSSGGAVGPQTPYGYIFAKVVNSVYGASRSQLWLSTAVDGAGHYPALVLGHKSAFDYDANGQDCGPGTFNYRELWANGTIKISKDPSSNNGLFANMAGGSLVFTSPLVVHTSTYKALALEGSPYPYLFVQSSAGREGLFQVNDDANAVFAGGLTSGTHFTLYSSGAQRLHIDASGVIVPYVPMRPLNDNTDDWGNASHRIKNFYLAGRVNNGSVNVLGQPAAGWSTATGTATRSAFDTTNVSLEQLAEHVKALIDDLHTASGNHGLLKS